MSRQNQQDEYYADEGSLVTEPEPRPVIAAGTPMRKVVPPRLVGPYLTGQRDVLAGYVYRSDDLAFRAPAEAYDALSLGFDGSEFTPGMSEFHVICWPARPADGYWQKDTATDIPEFYIDPIPIPVGATMRRVGEDVSEDSLVATYDGLAWQPAEA
jgi:hypothetical protein